jgi:hypothetical protein
MTNSTLFLEYDLLAAKIGFIQCNQWLFKDEDQRPVL